MQTVRLDLAYHGAGFSGWAVQPGFRTVQGELGEALGRIFGEPVTLTVAGRTDAGVHAWGQVASFVSPREAPEALGRALNALTGPDLAVLGVAVAADGFDARRDARSRTYCYRVVTDAPLSPFERGFALWWPRPLDLAKLDVCAELTIGTHDFTAFTPTQTEHVRFERNVRRCEWRRTDAWGLGGDRGDPKVTAEADRAGVLELWIEADSFMRRMVRVLVGTMLETASGDRPVAEFAGLLRGASRSDAGRTARAHGLHLARVSYQ